MEDLDREEFLQREVCVFNELGYNATEDGNVYINDVDDFFTLVISVDEDTRKPKKCWMRVTNYFVESYGAISEIQDAYYQVTEDLSTAYNCWCNDYRGGNEEDE